MCLLRGLNIRSTPLRRPPLQTWRANILSGARVACRRWALQASPVFALYTNSTHDRGSDRRAQDAEMGSPGVWQPVRACTHRSFNNKQYWSERVVSGITPLCLTPPLAYRRIFPRNIYMITQSCFFGDFCLVSAARDPWRRPNYSNPIPHRPQNLGSKPEQRQIYSTAIPTIDLSARVYCARRPRVDMLCCCGVARVVCAKTRARSMLPSCFTPRNTRNARLGYIPCTRGYTMGPGVSLQVHEICLLAAWALLEAFLLSVAQGSDSHPAAYPRESRHERSWCALHGALCSGALGMVQLEHDSTKGSSLAPHLCFFCRLKTQNNSDNQRHIFHAPPIPTDFVSVFALS